MPKIEIFACKCRGAGMFSLQTHIYKCNLYLVFVDERAYWYAFVTIFLYY